MIHSIVRCFLLLSFLAWAQGAFAVCFSDPPTIEEEFKNSSIVCQGQVAAEKTTPESDGYLEGVTYTIAVKEVFRGSPSKKIQVFSENSSDRFPMTVGKTYLLFVNKEEGRLMVSNCGNSGESVKKAEELSTLRKMKPKASRSGTRLRKAH